jgi:4-amino-4-deoxy-L-arabinose transferase-like glycosyltransferase
MGRVLKAAGNLSSVLSGNLGVARLVLAHMLLWTLVPGLIHKTPPLDTLEVYMWARDWILVSSKHPNMAGWMLAVVHALTGGAYGWSAYLLAQLCTGTAMLFVYLLGREVTDVRSAGLGTILCCAVGYFSWFSPQYNANVASMPFWAAFVWAVWMARKHGTLVRWVVVGLVGAGVVYCKLSGALLLLVAGIYALVDPTLRRQLLTPGPWLAGALCIALFIPAALEISRQNYMIFDHVATKTTGTPNPLSFLGTQILMCGVMLLILAMSAKRASKPIGYEDRESWPDVPPKTRDDGLRFVTVFAFAPLLLLVLESLALRTQMRALWAIPMGNLFALAAVMWLHRSGVILDDDRIKRFVAAVILIGPLAYGVAKYAGSYETPPGPTNWPQREISQRFEALWEAETNAPLKLVGGDVLEAGIVALTAKHTPSLLIDLKTYRVPWITPERIKRDGLLAIWPYTYKPGYETFQELTKNCKAKPQSFKVSARPDGKPLVLWYCIFPPG